MEKAIKRYLPIFVLPTLAAFIIGFIAPFIMGVGLSFCEFTTVKDAKFVGISNYVKAFQDTIFRHSFWYTALFAIVSLIVINVEENERNKHLQDDFLYAEPDRWYCSWIYMAADF